MHVTVTPVGTAGLGISDHDLLSLTLKPRERGEPSLPGWVCRDSLFPPSFASFLNRQALRVGLPPIMSLVDKVWQRAPIDDSWVPNELLWQAKATQDASAFVRKVRRKVPGSA